MPYNRDPYTIIDFSEIQNKPDKKKDDEEDEEYE